MIYAKSIKGQWKEAFKSYEAICGLEPLYQDDVDSGKVSVRDAWNYNIQHLEDVLASVCQIKTPHE